MTLFTVGFKIDLTLRIFDCYFAEGEKILYWAALQLIKQNEKVFKSCDIEIFFKTMKTTCLNLVSDKFIQNCIKINIKRKDIAKY